MYILNCILNILDYIYSINATYVFKNSENGYVFELLTSR